MSAEAVVDLGVERLVRIEARIGGAESEGLRARWEFGRELLAERDGKGRLPNGRLTEVCQQVGASRTEVTKRIQFAERFVDEGQLRNAVTKFGSWHAIVEKALALPTSAGDNSDAPPAVLTGTYSTIVVDPPWQYGNTSTRGAAEDHYETMSIEELCALDIARDKSAPQSHLYLWATAGHLPEAFTVMQAWGFTYKTYLVWVKPQMGMGNYFRVSTELVLFGVKGGMRTNHRGLMNHFTARRGKHSAKPVAFRELVKQASPGPYLEMFNRCYKADYLTGCQCAGCADGWDVWGNQS